jgi:hypothetical protein
MLRLIHLLLLLVTVASLPMAHATPVDETWIPGLYDNGDGDAAILALTSLTGVAEVSVVPDASLLAPPARLADRPEAASPPAPRLALQGRAPPAA